MLLPGLVKLFVVKPTGVTGMLSSMGFPAAMLLAWVLIIAEIGSGIAILANWRIKYAVWPPIIILAVAVLVTTPWTNGSQFLMSIPTILLHLVALVGYWILGNEMKHSGSKK
jgi:uncharacterized membrane protein YphA (DoxX/SURF4 family)